MDSIIHNKPDRISPSGKTTRDEGGNRSEEYLLCNEKELTKNFEVGRGQENVGIDYAYLEFISPDSK